MKMSRRYRAEVVGSQQPQTMKPSWLAPVCQVFWRSRKRTHVPGLVRPDNRKTRKLIQRIFRCRYLPMACLEARLSGQTRPGTFKQRFRHSPKDLAHLHRQRKSSRRGCWFNRPARPHRRRRFSRGEKRIFTINDHGGGRQPRG
jgi:hypothetical protein